MQKATKNFDVPFGGKQLLIIGDIFQLPPVVQKQEKVILDSMYKSRWFFDCDNIGSFKAVLFKKIYRQSDENFRKLLNKFRFNNYKDEDLKEINKIINSMNLSLTALNSFLQGKGVTP